MSWLLSTLLLVSIAYPPGTHAGQIAVHQVSREGRFSGIEKHFKKENFINFEKECIIAEREFIKDNYDEYQDYMSQIKDQLTEPYAKTILSRYAELKLNDTLDYSDMDMEEHLGIVKACNAFSGYYVPVYGVRNFERILKPYCKVIEDAVEEDDWNIKKTVVIEGRVATKKKKKTTNDAPNKQGGKKKKKLSKKELEKQLIAEIEKEIIRLGKKAKKRVGFNIISHHHDGIDHPAISGHIEGGGHLGGKVTLPSFEIDVLKFERNGVKYNGGKYKRKFVEEMSMEEIRGIHSMCHKYSSHISPIRQDDNDDVVWKVEELKDDVVFGDVTE